MIDGMEIKTRLSPFVLLYGGRNSAVGQKWKNFRTIWQIDLSYPWKDDNCYERVFASAIAGDFRVLGSTWLYI